MDMATILGITGGIATGKSTVTAMFGDLGAQTLSADDVAHEILEPGSGAFEEVLQRFGRAIIASDGHIDRAKLGEIVFNDSEARKALNEITHPRIISALEHRIQEFRGNHPGGGVLVVEIPLLVECDLKYLVDKVIVVVAEQQAQLNRLTIRGISPDQASSRISSQMPLIEKVPLADWVITTDTSLEDTKRQVEVIWKEVTA